MCGFTVEPNGSDHMGCSYSISVTKTGRVITHNTKYMHATPISVEEYLQEQISKATGQLEGMQAAPTKVDELPRQQMQDHRMGVMQGWIQALEEKGKIRAAHSLYYQIWGPMISVQRIIPHPSGILVWLVLGMTTDWIAHPALLWQMSPPSRH